MKKAIIELLKKQSFQPNFLSLFINPFYFIRKGLYKGIREESSQLNGKLLDFGCGRKPYKNLFDVSDYVGLDIEVSGHDHKESEVDVFYDGKTIPFEDNTFDSIFCSEVLEHVFNIDEVLAEIKRVHKDNGKILLTIPFAWGEHEQPFDYARYTSFAIKDILERNNYSIVSLRKSNHFASALIQMWTLYIFSLFQSKSRLVNTIFTVIFIAPFNIIGSLLLLILPKQKDYYNNLIVVATNNK